MERPFVGKSKNELRGLVEEGGDDAKTAQAELDFRANKKGNKAPAVLPVLTPDALQLSARLELVEQSQARCETMIREILERLTDEEDDEGEGDEDDDE